MYVDYLCLHSARCTPVWYYIEKSREAPSPRFLRCCIVPLNSKTSRRARIPGRRRRGAGQVAGEQPQVSARGSEKGGLFCYC